MPALEAETDLDLAYVRLEMEEAAPPPSATAVRSGG